VPPIILVLWCLGIATKGLAAYRIVAKGLFHRLPILWAFILISVARSTALLAFTGNPRRDVNIAADSMPMMLLSEAFAITSVFWMVTENYPRWRRTGTISLATLAIIGAAAALLVRSAAVPKDWGYGWAQLWEAAVLLQRHGMVAMAVALAGVRFLMVLVRMVPVSPLARRAADVLCIDVALGLIVSVVLMYYGRKYRMVGYGAPVIAGMINGLLWAFWLPAAADVREQTRPRWRQDDDEASIDWRACIEDLLCRLRLQFTARL
jgi:hypothetical protein